MFLTPVIAYMVFQARIGRENEKLETYFTSSGLPDEDGKMVIGHSLHDLNHAGAPGARRAASRGPESRGFLASRCANPCDKSVCMPM